ncbi:MAG: hypothetical protein PHE83_08140 [Opitutaceae bacterium]|nr:hypothetical protein [Opitutaceae bacterium]
MKILLIILAVVGISTACVVAESKVQLSRQPGKVILALKNLDGWPEVKEIEAFLGNADRQVGSGRCIFVYVLADGSELWANTGDCKHIDWISWRQAGKSDEVLFEAKRKPNQQPERNAGATSSSTSTSTPGVAHP